MGGRNCVLRTNYVRYLVWKIEGNGASLTNAYHHSIYFDLLRKTITYTKLLLLNSLKINGWKIEGKAQA
jgi:hypothetical protein